ncbi:hypothetical protein PSPO01_00603 [Paraphaeosphaeria sporulosa]
MRLSMPKAVNIMATDSANHIHGNVQVVVRILEFASIPEL